MSYTDTVPLRISTEWQHYPAVYPLPVVYGRVRIKPQPYDDSGALWLLAGHAVQGIDAVTVEGQATDAYALQNGVDDTGKPVAALELATAVADRDKITVTLRGKQNAETGALLDRPDLILHDWLANVCGLDYAVSDFDDLRAWSQTNSVVAGGVIDEITTVQTATDKMAQGMGLAWGADIAGVAIPWPPEAITAQNGNNRQITAQNSDNLLAKTATTDITTALTYQYATDWATRKPTRAIRLQSASVDRFGRRDSELVAGWLQAAAAAESHAQRWLRWYGSAVWRIEAATAQNAEIGQHVGIEHPYSSLGGAVVIAVAGTPLSKTVTLEASELNAGNISVLSRSSGVDLDAKSTADYVYADGKLTYTVSDESGAPIARAVVTLDGSTQRQTDNAGAVQFTVGRGKHTLEIDAPGYIKQTVTVTL